MKLLKQALAMLGTVAIFATVVAFVAPERVHAVVAALVQVENTPAQSIPTRRTDNDGRDVVRLAYAETMNAGTTASNGTGNGVPLNDAITNSVYTVPSGKRLVIDTVSMFAFPDLGQKVYMYVTNGYTFTAIPAIDAGFPTTYAAHFGNTIPVRDYVEPGGQYSVVMQRSDSTDTMFWDVLAVGHLVDCTNGGGC